MIRRQPALSRAATRDRASPLRETDTLLSTLTQGLGGVSTQHVTTAWTPAHDQARSFSTSSEINSLTVAVEGSIPRRTNVVNPPSPKKNTLKIL